MRTLQVVITGPYIRVIGRRIELLVLVCGAMWRRTFVIYLLYEMLEPQPAKQQAVSRCLDNFLTNSLEIIHIRDSFYLGERPRGLATNVFAKVICLTTGHTDVSDKGGVTDDLGVIAWP